MNEFKIGDKVWMFASFCKDKDIIYLEDFYLCECIISDIKINSCGRIIYIVYDACDSPGSLVYEAEKENMYYTKLKALQHLLERIVGV